MGQFTVRVELHGTNGNEKYYENLHELMGKAGFTRTITSNEGIEYHLPPAEYNMEKEKITKKEVINLAKDAAAKTGREYSVLVTESKGRTWYNLDEVKKPQTKQQVPFNPFARN